MDIQKLRRLTQEMAMLKNAKNDIQVAYNKKKKSLLKGLTQEHLKHVDTGDFTATKVSVPKKLRFSKPLLRKLNPKVYNDKRYYKASKPRTYIRLKHDLKHTHKNY